MNKHITGALLVLLAPMGCGGVASDVAPKLAQPSSAVSAASSPRALRPAGLRATYINFSAVDPSGSAVAELGTFAATANGNVAPTQLIRGSNTGLTYPMGATRDVHGRFWTCDFNTNAIEAFAPEATGNVKPIVTINGSNNPVRNCDGVALDSRGSIFATSFSASASLVAVWRVGATGNAAPAKIYSGSATGIHQPAGLTTVNVARFYVTNAAGSIEQFTGVWGNVTPVQSIGGSNTQMDFPSSVTIDPTTSNIVVTDYESARVLTFAAGAAGNVAPLRIIGGSLTHLVNPASVTVDAAGYTYVGNCPSGGEGSIVVFAPGASGNVSPVQTIQGSSVNVRCVLSLTAF